MKLKKRWIILIISVCLILFTLSCLLAQDSNQPAETKAAPVKVKGIVFEDLNGNGKKDAGEKSLGGVRVSDGFSVVRTRGDGSYNIDSVERSRSKFVFVIVPCGHASTSFYSAIPKEGAEHEADFALIPDINSLNRRFSFAQITDIHVTNDAGPMVEDLAEIAAFKPSFIVATGDLVNDGRIMSQLETYRDGISKSVIPVRNLPGNHDGGGNPVNYEELFGPDYYSFDYGGCHFVMFNSCDDSDIQQQWLKNDLKEAGNMPVLFFQHYHPTPKLMQTLEQYNTIGVFSGHWHTTKTFPHHHRKPSGAKSSMLYVNTPPLTFGGIDISPRGFVLAYVDHGKLKIEHRFGGVKKKLSIVFPADGSDVAEGLINIRFSAYDSASPLVKVDYRIDNGPWRSAKQVGLFTWSAQERLKAAAHSLTARCVFKDGTPVEKEVHFSASPRKANVPSSGKDWPMLRRDVLRTGISDDVVTPPLEPAWTACLGGSAHGASPVVAGGILFMGIADEDCSGRQGVYALDARTGTLRWSYHTIGSVRNSVAVDNGTVYALSVAGEVVALDAKTGKLKFQHNMDGVSRWLFSSPAVKDGVLYVGSGAELLALDAVTGAQIWTADRMTGDWISCLTSPVVESGKVFMGSNWGNGLFALNRRTGKIVWNNKAGYRTTHATPVLVDGRLYHAADNKLHCADAVSGRDIWTFDLPGTWTLSSPVVKDGRVFVGGPDGVMYCVDAASGKKIWETPSGDHILCFTPYGRSGNPFISSPVVSGNTVYCGSGDGKLYAYNAEDGKILWSYDLGVPITSSPAISGNSVYIVAFDGSVYAFVEKR